MSTKNEQQADSKGALPTEAPQGAKDGATSTEAPQGAKSRALPTEAPRGAKVGYKHTKLGWIPQEWEVNKLGSLGSFSKGKGLSKAELTEEGIPCITYGELYTIHDIIIKEFISFTTPTAAKNSRKLKKNSILFAGSGETAEEIGKCAAFLGDEDAYAGGDIVIFQPQDLDSFFLSLALNSQPLIHQRARLGQGYSVVHIYADHLAEQLLPLPPLPEQRRIAAILGTWDSAIAKVQQLLAAQQERKRGLMQELLSGKSRFKGFDGEWQEVRLGELGEISNGGTPDTTIDEYWNGDIPWFTPTEITALAGKVMIRESVRNLTKQGLANCTGSLLPAGAVIVCTRATVGIAAILDVPGTTNQGFKNIVPNDRVSSKFLYYQIMAHAHALQRLACGSTFPEVSMKDFRNLKIPVPAPAEQDLITSVFDAIDKSIEQVQNYLTHITTQKRGLMQQLLTGAVRVKV